MNKSQSQKPEFLPLPETVAADRVNVLDVATQQLRLAKVATAAGEAASEG